MFVKNAKAKITHAAKIKKITIYGKKSACLRWGQITASLKEIEHSNNASIFILTIEEVTNSISKRSNQFRTIIKMFILTTCMKKVLR